MAGGAVRGAARARGAAHRVIEDGEIAMGAEGFL